MDFFFQGVGQNSVKNWYLLGVLDSWVTAPLTTPLVYDLEQ